jgi:hypothetical protein
MRTLFVVSLKTLSFQFVHSVRNNFVNMDDYKQNMVSS